MVKCSRTVAPGINIEKRVIRTRVNLFRLYNHNKLKLKKKLATTAPRKKEFRKVCEECHQVFVNSSTWYRHVETHKDQGESFFF